MVSTELHVTVQAESFVLVEFSTIQFQLNSLLFNDGYTLNNIVHIVKLHALYTKEVSSVL